jgi:hypothetical protein
MKKVLLSILSLILILGLGLVYAMKFAPRPPDTTEARVFAGDASLIDHCDLPNLDGRGLAANDIPKAFTPQCGWDKFPMPVLANCSEPLAPDAVDMRGLWQAASGLPGHIERIEQCGNRVVVTSSGVIHDFRTDGTLKNGSRDIEPPSCINTYVSIDYQDRVMSFHPFGLPFTIVTRRMEKDELVWSYPRIKEEVRMNRICYLPGGD